MSRWLSGWIVLMSAGLGASADAEPGSRCTTDRQIIDTLARVHDQGAALFNAGDHNGCYRMFQGALATVQMILPRDLQETVQRGLARAELSGDVIRRAMALHELIEEVRRKLHPTASQGEALPKPRPVPMEPSGTPGPLPPNPKTAEPIQPPKPSTNPGLSPPNLDVSTLEPPKAPAIPPRDGVPPPPPVTSNLPTSQPRPRAASESEGRETSTAPSRPTEPVPPWDDRPAKSSTAEPSPAPRTVGPKPPFELDPAPVVKPKEPAPASPMPPLNLEPPPEIKPKEPATQGPKPKPDPMDPPPLPQLSPPGVPRTQEAPPNPNPPLNLEPPPPIKAKEPGPSSATSPLNLEPPPPIKAKEPEKLPAPRLVPELSVPPLETPPSKPRSSDVPPLLVPGK